MRRVLLRALYANCFPPASIEADVLLTDERAVADAVEAERGIPVLCPEDAVEPGAAHAQSIEMWKLAYSWFRSGEEDMSATAGDLGGRSRRAGGGDRGHRSRRARRSLDGRAARRRNPADHIGLRNPGGYPGRRAP